VGELVWKHSAACHPRDHPVAAASQEAVLDTISYTTAREVALRHGVLVLVHWVKRISWSTRASGPLWRMTTVKAGTD